MPSRLLNLAIFPTDYFGSSRAERRIREFVVGARNISHEDGDTAEPGAKNLIGVPQIMSTYSRSM
eukprot:SAG31_NODE_695_length_12765_cov_6.974499_1_plen_65_part_00